MTACVINGERCTKCCQAINLPMSLYDAQKIFRKRREASSEIKDDIWFVSNNWTPISRRRAKKINPYLVKRQDKIQAENKNRNLSYWVCNKLTESGCGIYKTRPKVCSGYPIYPHLLDGYIREIAKRPPEYHPECTEWPRIDGENLIPTING